VDDILLMRNDIPLLQLAKSSLNKLFSMEDLGESVYILGIKIYKDRSKRPIGLSQSTYIDKVFNRFSMQNSKKGFQPMNHGAQLRKTQCHLTTDERSIMSRVPYDSAIGSIMYVMLCTRSDVSYAWSVTSRYQTNSGLKHWNAAKNMFFIYGVDSELVVSGYTDVITSYEKS
jgi:Reverse transcriptase (RNA-dependent DNA polymerase)